MAAQRAQRLAVRYFGRSTFGNPAGQPEPTVVGYHTNLIANRASSNDLDAFSSGDQPALPTLPSELS